MRGLLDTVATPHSLLGLLPGIYAEDDLACRLVAAFDDALAPVFVTLDNLTGYLDPLLAPEDFLRWLGEWVGAVDDPALTARRRRLLVAGAVALHARRGTAAGLADAVALATGARPDIRESGGVTWSRTAGAEPPGTAEPGVVVTLDATAAEVADGEGARVLDALVETLRPAHLPYRIEESP